MMAKIVEVKMSKGITVEREGEKWTKKSLELTVAMPEKHTDEEVQAILTRADTFLGQPEAAQVPEVNPEDLMKHDWKGKKDGKGGYLKGSTAWGWDFRDQFSEDTIRALEKTSSLVIDEYEFTLGKTIVQAKKKK